MGLIVLINKDNKIFLSKWNPKRTFDGWTTKYENEEHITLPIFSHLFEFIHSKYEHPFKISDLINHYEEKNNINQNDTKNKKEQTFIIVYLTILLYLY